MHVGGGLSVSAWSTAALQSQLSFPLKVCFPSLKFHAVHQIAGWKDKETCQDSKHEAGSSRFPALWSQCFHLFWRDPCLRHQIVTPQTAKSIGVHIASQIAFIALQIAVDALDFYTEYTQLSQPLGKFDLVAVPGKTGAMENWGLLLFDEHRFLVNNVRHRFKLPCINFPIPWEEDGLNGNIFFLVWRAFTDQLGPKEIKLSLKKGFL